MMRDKNDWEVKQLTEICFLERGCEHGSITYNDKKEGHRFIRVADISKQITNPIWSNSKNLVVCKKDDILMTFDGSPGVVFKGIEGAISSGIRIIKPIDENIILKDYLFYFLQTKNVQNIVKQYTVGSSILHASRSIPYMKIPIPPLSIQNKIVSILEKCESVKEKRKEANRLTDEFLKSTFLEMFGDPVKNPKRWNVNRIVGFIEKIDNENPNIFSEKKYNYIDISSIDNISKTIIEQKNIKGNTAPSRARQLIKAGDILISTVRPNLNAVAIVPEGLENSIASTDFCVLRTKDNLINKKYLFEITKTKYFVESLVKIAKGASYPAVTDNDIKGLCIPIPPIESQQKFAEIVQKVEKLKEKQHKSEKELNNLFDSLMQKAFKGELN